MSDIAISVKNISKTFKIPHERIDTMRGAFVNAFRQNSYETFNALDDVSFEVKKGEFFGIIGRNGSGKSTLLKILAGIYSPDKGKIHVNGRISPFLELGIGFNPELSGRDNVYLNATVLGLSKKQIDAKFDDIVRFSELERFIDQKIKNYSSGMQVRLAFSVAIHANRDILLMDEVLAVGDSNFQSKCLEEFNKYRDLGKTVILVTHDISTIQRYCDRALLLRNGKIEKIGNADEVGREYIYQNMSDEERRMMEEQRSKEEKLKNKTKKNKDNRKQDKDVYKIAEITEVRLFDKNDKEKYVFQNNEYIKVLIKFNLLKPCNEFDIRISLETAEGFYLFGYDTFSEKFLINKKEGMLSLRLINPPFLQGQYYINASCFGANGTKELDFKPRIRCFKIYSNIEMRGYKGIINVEHQWTV
jgi:ABC-2 type transport system ATP-binding protein